MRFTAKGLQEHLNTTQQEKNGVWQPVRPERLSGFGGLKSRIKDAFAVLFDRADIVIWPDMSKLSIDEMYTATDLPLNPRFVNVKFASNKPTRLDDDMFPISVQGVMLRNTTILKLHNLPGSNLIPFSTHGHSVWRSFVDTGTHNVQVEFDATTRKLTCLSSNDGDVVVRLERVTK